MGPVFGVKGGATGGGKSEIIPSNEINLHFTGDFHAIAQANNLLSSIIDNHIYFGNDLKIDTSSIFHKRCLDINDRSLRGIEYHVRYNKISTGFNITAASEVMAIACLSSNMSELKKNLGNILVAKTVKGQPVFARDLNAAEPMAALLADAMKPNLVQTKEGTPALVHFGPFANIAHGCNSIIATQTALSHADYCVTEAGFGSDLGAQKFIDIKSRIMNRTPDAAILVVVVGTTKEHGNGDLEKGFENVKRHIHNIKELYNLPLVVAINRHKEDTKEDLSLLAKLCEAEDTKVVMAEGFVKGGEGCTDLAKEVIKLCKQKTECHYSYNIDDPIKKKIIDCAKNVYGAGKVEFTKEALNKIAYAKKLSFSKFFINIAKTQFSFTDSKINLGAPKNHTFHITDIEIRSGAKMIVAIAGDMVLMPGLAKRSAYNDIFVDENNNIQGIF